MGTGENEIKRIRKVSQKAVEGRGNAMEPTPGSCADGSSRARAGLSRVFSHLVMPVIVAAVSPFSVMPILC